MPVDFQQIFERVREIGAGAGERQRVLEERQAKARDLLESHAADLDFLRAKVEAAKAVDPSIRCAAPVKGTLTAAFPSPLPPPEATLIAADRSVRWAAAEMASGKMALVPMPTIAKPISETTATGEKKTSSMPAVMTQIRRRATPLGECRSTKLSAKKRVDAWQKAKSATAKPAMKGPEANTSRM